MSATVTQLAQFAPDLPERRAGLDGFAGQLLDRVPRALLLGGRDARILYCNAAAHALLADGDGLCLAGGRLLATRDRDAQALRRAWGTAMDNGAADACAPLVEVTRPSRRAPYQVAFSALNPSNAGQVAATTTLAIQIFDPAVLPRFDEGRLRQLYRLTRCEAHVAIAVAQGRDIAAIAVATSRREGTVRTLLKRAFAKTGTCRQNALAAVLWAGAGSISSL